MTRTRHIVIVDDEPNIGRSLRLILEHEGYRVTVCESAATFHAERRRVRADLYLLDVRLPDGNGIDLLRAVRQSDETTPVVMISGHGTIRDAVDATRSGAFDFLEKPLARDRVLLVTKHALERSDLQRENQRFRELVGDAPSMIGSSPAFLHAVDEATQVARSDVSVLLLGESGTGKELLAAHIHRESPFASGPFVKVNCAAIPTELIESELFGHEKGAFTGAAALRRGKFEQADGGTIFLDEVGDLHEASQAKLLRILQDGELQRVGGEQPFTSACASSQPPTASSTISSRRGGFARTSTIGCASSRSACRRCASAGRTSAISSPTFSPSSARATTSGRARSIRTSCPCSSATPGPATCASSETSSSGWRFSRAAIASRAESIPLEVRRPEAPRPAAGLQEVRDAAERERIRQALDQTDWNVSGAARLLGTERTSLHKRLRALGLKRK